MLLYLVEEYPMQMEFALIVPYILIFLYIAYKVYDFIKPEEFDDDYGYIHKEMINDEIKETIKSIRKGFDDRNS